LPELVSSQDDIETLIRAFKSELDALHLWQYYVLDAAQGKASVMAAVRSNHYAQWDGSSIAGKSVAKLAQTLRASGKIRGLGKLAGRFQVTVDDAVAAGFIKAAFVEMSEDANAFGDAWVRVVDMLNVPLYEEWENDMKVALDNIKSRLVYTRLEENGPKMGKISKQLVPIYPSRFSQT
jgi:glycogen debranching enzyme